LVYPTGYPQSIHRFPQRSGPRPRATDLSARAGVPGKWRNSAEEWRQRGLHPVNGDELCKFLGLSGRYFGNVFSTYLKNDI